MGIFYLIQLSWVPIRYNIPMLWASLYFFSKTTNNFHFPYRMFGPTLFDLVVIAGLAPIGSLIDPFYFPNKQFSIITKPLSYNKFVRNNYKKSTSKVSTSEHIAFLWFSSTPLSSAPSPSKFKKIFYPWSSWSMRSMNFSLVNSYYLIFTLSLPRLSTLSRIRMMLPVRGPL